MAEQEQSDGGAEATRVQSPVERLCSEFAANWRSGRRPDLDSFLNRLPPDERSSGLVNLLRIEVQARRERGEEASEEEYRQRFPEASDAISIAFSTRGQTEEKTWAEIEWSLATPALERLEPTQLDPDQRDVVQRDVDQVQPVPVPPAQRRVPLEEPSPWRAGVMLGSYRLEEFLGRGGFGEVWKGRDTLLYRSVAIKLLRPKHLNSAHHTAFFAEGQKLEMLRRQGARVLEVLSADVCAGWPYLVTRYLPGGTLERRIRERPRDWREACRVVAELAETLGLTHAQQVYHRDIKPANVLLDEQGQVYLADFGLATSEEQQVREGPSTGGTWCYKAPEQGVAAAGITGGRTDIYALGVVLYEWLTGRRPGLPDRVLHEQWLADPELRAQPPRELNGEVPEEVQAVCLAMLEKDDKKRNITAGDVARRLRGVLVNAECRILPTERPRASWNPKVLLGATLAVLLALPATLYIGRDIGRGWWGGERTASTESAGSGGQRSVAIVAGENRQPEAEEPLPEVARNLIQPISEFHHARKWQGALPVPPGLLNFPGRRDHGLFLVTPDDRKVLLTTAYPQFLPFSMVCEKPLQEVQLQIAPDDYDLWCGFFYNFREVPTLQGGVEFMGLLMYSTAPINLPREVYVVHALWRIDPKAGGLRWDGAPVPQRVFSDERSPEEFQLTLRLTEGRLTEFLLNQKWYACPVTDPPGNPIVGGPMGLVLQGGSVQLSPPRLKFQP
jgi:serine/threonine protein kinase